jgi:SAM-dependent methyltransferase
MIDNTVALGGDNLLILADGSTIDLGALSHEQLVDLQWRQEQDFARRILSTPKGSAERAAAVSKAYDSIAQIIAKTWGSDDKPMSYGYNARLGRLILKILGRQQRRVAMPRFFEIGYANGSLLKLVSDAGFPISGIEVSAKLREQACRLLGRAAESCLHLGDFLRLEISESERPCQVIYWNDVFEHIPPDEIRDYLRRIHELLAPGGQLVTVTPNWHERPSDVTRIARPPRTEAAGLHLKEYTLREATALLRNSGFHRVATPLFVAPRRIALCGNGAIGVKIIIEPTLELMPFKLARLLCRRLGLSITIATKSGG